jgi:hypothetical protein
VNSNTLTARIVDLHAAIQRLDLQGFWGLAESFRKILEKELKELKDAEKNRLEKLKSENR